MSAVALTGLIRKSYGLLIRDRILVAGGNRAARVATRSDIVLCHLFEVRAVVSYANQAVQTAGQHYSPHAKSPC